MFGSAAGNRFDPKKSDLDLLVEFEKMTPADHANSISASRKILKNYFPARSISFNPARSEIRISANYWKRRRSKLYADCMTPGNIFSTSQKPAI